MPSFFSQVPPEIRHGFFFAFLAMILTAGIVLWLNFDAQVQLLATLGIGIAVYAGVVWAGFRKRKNSTAFS